MNSFEDRGYRWAEITNLTDMQQNRRVFVRGARLDVPGSKIAQLADEVEEAGSTFIAGRLRELLT